MDSIKENPQSSAENCKISRSLLQRNTSHLFVHTTTSVNGTAATTARGLDNGENRRCSNDIIDKFVNSRQQPKCQAFESENGLDDIIRNNNFFKHHLREEPFDINETIILPSKLDLSKVTTCSKTQVPGDQQCKDNIPINPFSIQNSETVVDSKNPTEDNNRRAEKTTYCRPIVNLYDHEYLYKTMQRNARLQKLVKKLVAARQNEKQREAWNNYINDLKNKHKYYSNEPRHISPQYVPEEPQILNYNTEDYFKMQSHWKQSILRENLLHNLYETTPNSCLNDNIFHNYPYKTFDNLKRSQFLCTPYATEHFCYPTSSQNRMMMMMNREKIRNNNDSNQRILNSSGRYFHGNTITVERDYQSKIKDHMVEKRKNTFIRNPTNTTLAVTDAKPLPLVNEEYISDEEDHEETITETAKEKLKKVTKNIAKLKKKLMKSDDSLKLTPLANIEGKIDNLVKSVNTLILEIRETRNSYCRNSKSASISCKISKHSDNHVNMTRSDTYGLLRTEEILCGVVQTHSNNLMLSEIASSKVRRRESDIVKIDEIIVEEQDKSNQIKRDIEELLKVNAAPCSVKITFDIPTKELPTIAATSSSTKEIETKVIDTELSSGDQCMRSSANVCQNTQLDKITEMTASVDKTKIDSVKTETVVDCDTNYIRDNKCPLMTIAVNTDPLSLLTLLRMSTDSLKQVLSFMPNLNYLSLLLSGNNYVSAYICNFCGAAFNRPSQLSEHVSQHYLGRTRDCCVCRHVLDKPRHRIGHFTCQYCGEQFTRAYCCELHQQTCAKHHGKIHDVTSSRMILR